MTNVIWRPQPKQIAFMRRGEYEALYGGAAGGGKSDALLAEALRQVHIPHYKGIIFRKTYPQLSELIDRSRLLYGLSFPKAEYNQTEKRWTFPSGAQIFFGSMQHTKDRTNYQGKRYDFIAFDELTHFTFDEYAYMFSRNRPGGPGTRVYIRAATNPGGIGHGWVKERFISPAPPLTPIKGEYEVYTPEGVRKMTRSRVFVPATVFDNAALLKNDPNYIANLSLLPGADKDALLYGSWDSFEGQVFTEWRNDPAHYEDGVGTHVIAPFNPPKHWRVYRGFDFGYAKPYSVGWYAVDEDGRMYRTVELYGCTDTPNHGVMQQPAEIAAEIARMEREHEYLCGRNIIGVADPSIFDESRGASVADIMAREGVYFTGGDNTRIPGKMQYHYRFAFGDDGRPMLYIFNTCKHFIRTIPSLVYDDKHVEDIDTDGEDHIYDECRYVLMERPIAARKPVERKPREFDPLDDTTYDRYKSWR